MSTLTVNFVLTGHEFLLMGIESFVLSQAKHQSKLSILSVYHWIRDFVDDILQMKESALILVVMGSSGFSNRYVSSWKCCF